MAEFYRSEIGLLNDGIREGGYAYNRRGFDDESNEIEGYRSLTRSHDHGMSTRVLNTSSRFEWNSLMDESRGGLRSSGVREDARTGEFARHEENYDGFVERSLPVERERTRNVITYDPIVDELRGGSRSNAIREDTRVSGFHDRSLPFVSERSRNVPTYDRNVEDSEYLRDHSVKKREYPSYIERLTRPHYDDENDHGFLPGDGSHSLTPRALSNGQRIPFQGIANEGDYAVTEGEYPPRLDRISVRHPYDDERGLRCRREEGSHSLTPRSQSSGQRTPFQVVANDLLPEIQYHSADGPGSGSRLHPSRSSRYHCTPYSKTGGTSHPFPTEAISPRGNYAPSVHRPDDYIQHESRRSTDFYRETLSEDNYGGDQNLQEYNDQEGIFGIDAVNAALPSGHYDGYSNRDLIVEDEYSGPQNISPPLKVAPSFDNSDLGMMGYGMVYGEVNHGSRNYFPEHSTKVVHGSLPHEEQVIYERSTRGMTNEGHYVNSPRGDRGEPLVEEFTRQILETRDFSLSEQPNTTRKRMHEFVDKMRDAKRRGLVSYDDWHLSEEGERELGHFNWTPRHHHEPHTRPHIGKPLQRPLPNPQEHDRGDVKKRLTFPPAASRPCAPQLPWIKEVKSKVKPSPHVTHPASSVKPHEKAKGPDFKKKLKSVRKPVVCPSGASDPVILDSGVNMKKKQKVATKDFVSVNDAPRSQVVNPDRFLLKVKRLEELREDSIKFKQQVDEWFLKCIWYIFGNIGCQERFKGRGNGGLKCIICPSSSPEFAHTKDVAMHAFSSPTVGYRAQHLGFYRALCALMGWDRAVPPDGIWACKSLPGLVVWNLKEDVIIWPPVVIIHKNPARNNQLNELGKVSIDPEMFLRDNGFTREIKSCHKNPGNQSMMVVKFNGTLSGFKEAERLHTFFAEKKHGRVELAQIDAEVVCCKLLYKMPEDELKLFYKIDDHKPVNKSKDEQPEYKTEVYQTIIDKREVHGEPLHRTNFDQELVVTAQDGQEPIDMVQDDQTPIATGQDGQTLVAMAQDDKTLIVTAQDNRKLVVTGQDDQTHVATAQNDQKPVATAQDDQNPVATAQDDQKPVAMAQDNHIPVVTSSQDDRKSSVTTQDDQTPAVMSQDDQTPAVMSQDDQTPVVTTQDDQTVVVTALNNQKAVVTAQDGQTPIVTGQDDQEPMVMALDDQEHIAAALVDHASSGKTENDQALVNKSENVSSPIGNVSDCQAPLDKKKIDQELSDKAECDEKHVVKGKDDQESVGKTESALYGYLGIIEDLNILHHEIICHHCARSKKEILAFL